MKFNMLKLAQPLSLLSKIRSSALLAVLFLIGNTQGIAQSSVTFNYTGAVQYYTVPSCVTTIQVTCAGAQGGGPTGNSAGGRGAIMTGTIAVVPGQILEIRVGGQGVQVLGGWNGGGAGQSVGAANTNNTVSWGGGGASDIRVAPYALANRRVVGGGGGGTASQSGQYTIPGGNGGCVNGFAGGGSPFTGTGGGGGTQTAPGNGGPPWGPAAWGSAGVGPVGGTGAPFYNNINGTGGGGGGGGYFGGGGGGADGCCPSANGGAAGGGGSSYALNQVSCVQGTTTGNTGHGYVTINTSNAITASNTGPYCVGATIQLNCSSGSTGYSWTGPNGFTSLLQNPTIPNANSTHAGVYTCSVTTSGCAATSSTTVNVVGPITPNAGIDDTVCFGSPFQLTGTITVSTDPSSWSYQATTSPPGVASFFPASNNLNPTVTVTQPGVYNFILSESNPVCGLKRDTVVMFVKKMDIQTSFTNPTCNGSADGTITATGTDAIEYSYNNGATWSTTPGTGFTAGTYTVCVRDYNMCQACTTVTLTNPPPVIISVSNDTLVCENGTATLVASAINGTGFQYLWSQFPTTADTQYGSPVVDTYYYVQAQSAAGCLSNMDSIYVTVRPPISGTISPDASICPGYTTMLTATAQDGIGAPFTFTWSDGTVGFGSTHSFLVSPPYTQNYTVTITDACESSPLVLTNEITVSPLPAPAFLSDTTEKCEPAEFEVYVTTPMTDYVTATWLISDGQFYANMDTINTSAMMEGMYNVQLVLVNQYGCIDSVTYQNYLVSHPLPVSAFKFYPNTPTMFSTEVTFTNFSVHANASAWTFASGTPGASNLSDPTTSFPEGETGFYNVQLIVTSNFGCLDTSWQTVEVKPEVILYAPNTFTPDGDEFNPTWGVHIIGIDVQDFHLELRNRWGQLVWETRDVNGQWDGTFGNERAMEGTYNWFIRAKDSITDEPYLFKGHVSILR